MVNIGPKIGIDGEAEYRKSINNLIQQGKTLAAEMQTVAESFDESTSKQERNRKTAEVLTKQINVQKERIELLNRGLADATRELGSNDTKTLKWKQAVAEATAQLSKMEKQLEQTAQEADDLGDETDKARQKALSFGDVLKANVIGDLVVDGLRSMASAVAELGKEFVSTGFEYNKTMESYTANFEVMLGNAEAAGALVGTLKDMGASTPFEMTDLANATQTLLAFNVEAGDAESILTQLGDISLGNVSKLESLTRAYGKMNASQKVTLEDINMMIDAGFNPLLIVAEETGQTMQDVYARISKGEVAFSEIQDAIEKATKEGGQFYQGMQKASKTTDGLISTLEDNANALVGKVFEPISESLREELLPGAIDAVEGLTNAFEENGVEGMVDAVGEILDEASDKLASEIPGLVKPVASGLAKMTPSLIKGATELFSGVVSAIPVVAAEVLKEAPAIGMALLEGLGTCSVAITEASMDLFIPFHMAIDEARDKITTAGSAFTPFMDAVAEAETAIVDLSGMLSENGNTIAELDDKIGEVEDAITEIYKREFAEQDGYRQKDLEALRKYMDELDKLQMEKLGIYRNQQLAELRKIELDAEDIDKDAAVQHIASAKATLKESNKITEEMYTAELVRIENYYASRGEVGSEAYEEELQKAKENYEALLEENEDYYDKSVAIVSDASSQWVEESENSWDSLVYAAQYTQSRLEYIGRNAYDLGIMGVIECSRLVSNYGEQLAKLDYENTQAFLSLQAQLVSSGDVLGEEAQRTVETVLGAYKDLPPDLRTVGKDSLLQLIAGMEVYIPELENASNMTANEIVSVIEGYLFGKDEKMVWVGKNTVDDMISGMNARKGSLSSAAQRLAKSAYDSALNKLGVSVDVPSSKYPGSLIAVNGSHASGLDYVPFDGYIAELHEGEMVLTSDVAELIRGGYSETMPVSTVNTYGDFNIAIYQQPGESASELAERIMDIIQTKVTAKEAVF